jgi:hypothetical protein
MSERAGHSPITTKQRLQLPLNGILYTTTRRVSPEKPIPAVGGTMASELGESFATSYIIAVDRQPDQHDVLVIQHVQIPSETEQLLSNWEETTESIGGKAFPAVIRTVIMLAGDYSSSSPAPNSAMPIGTDGRFNGAGYVLWDRSCVKTGLPLEPVFRVDRRVFVIPQTTTGQTFAPEGMILDEVGNIVPEGTAATQAFLVEQSNVEPMGNGNAIKITRTPRKRNTNGTTEAGFPKKQTKRRGTESGTPSKFRRLTKTVVTTTQKELSATDVDGIPDPPALTGDQLEIEHRKVNDHRYEEIVTSEILDEGAAPLVTPSQEDQLYITVESMVLEGAAPDKGPGVLLSRVDAIGNGKAVKTTRIALSAYTSSSSYTAGFSIFATVTEGKQETIPAVFLAKLGMKTWEFKVSANAYPTSPTLGVGSGEYAGYYLIERIVKKVQDQPSPTSGTEADTYEVVVVGLAEGSETIVDSAVTSSMTGGVLTVTQELVDESTSPQPEEGFLILESSVRDLQNGKMLVETRAFDEPFSELYGQTYDADIGLDIPFSEQIVEAGTAEEAADIQPMDKWRSKLKKIDYDAYKLALEEVHIILPGEDNVQIPDTLQSVTVLVSRAQAIGNSFGQGSGFNMEMSGTVSLSADLSYEIEEGYAGPVPAETHIFFMAQDQVDAMDFIKAKCNADLWPRYRPSSKRMVIAGNGMSQRVTIKSSDNGSGGSESSDVQAFTNVATIPRTIHGEVVPTIEYHDFIAPTGLFDDIRDQAIATWAARLAALQALVDEAPVGTDPFVISYLTSYITGMEETLEMASDQDIEDFVVALSPTVFAATEPAAVQEGRFITKTNAQLYGFGMVKVTAIVAIV